MQPFTKQLIFDRIADSGYVFWTLYLHNGFKSQSHILSYYGVDFDPADTQETMIEKSIAKLDNVITSFPPDAVFSIELKNSKSANGTGIIGSFQFTNTTAADAQNLSGAPAPVPYLTEETLKGITAQMEQNFKNQIEQLKAESLLRERENELKRKQDELAIKMQEVADLKKSYDSGVAKSADVLFQAGKKLIMAFVPALIPADGAAVLSGTQQPTVPVESTPAQESTPDVKADAVDDLAAYLYDNFTINDIQELKQRLKNEKVKSNIQNAQQSADDTAGEFEND